jgi:rhodanese-related sulfurtransferase
MRRSAVAMPFLLAFIALDFLAGCSDNKVNSKEPAESVAPALPVKVDRETTLLLDDLAENGDYVNSRDFPSLIKASVVYENIGNNMLVIDIRPPEKFAVGHIKGAVNKRFEDLPDYFETGIKPYQFERIILVSEDGQVSSYATCLLRLMGYGNVYSMRWGMSAWDQKDAEQGWLGSVSGKYEANLETAPHEKPAAKEMPLLNTGLSTGAEIGTVRFKKLFEEGTDNILISADEVFSNPENYFVINYDRKDKYEEGHIPGAVRFKPDATLGVVSEMTAIPSDKTVVVYCGTGHNSAFVTAYLRLFGYDAKTLKYGNNGFMYDKMVREKASLSWLPFTSADINNYPVKK